MANEIEPALRLAARAYAREEGVSIPEAHFANLDWLKLQDGLPDGQYDAVYVLGNSLCHLESESQVERAIENFSDVLAPGGVLICDERNFDYITSEWDNIKGDPWNRFRFNRREEKVMYHGEQVMGAPVDRRNGRVIFEYAEVNRDATGIHAGARLGYLNMLAFGKGTLKGKLEDKFANVEVYCDLQPSQNGKLDDAADFFAYVATKKAEHVS